MSNRFVSKPVVIEARRFLGGAEGARELVDWILEEGHQATYFRPREEKVNVFENGSKIFLAARDEHVRIDTLEGPMMASVGDWIIKGIEGEFYPCKDSVFRNKYEPVADPN